MSLKITVLKTTLDQDLAGEYWASGPAPCPYFTAGQAFVVERFRKPEGFCTWAWNDVYRVFQTLRSGGRFDGWSKNGNALIRCCTSGVRCAIFNLEWIDD
jgi:uncharacterized repeat protein (TIGR04076 family)